MATPFLTSSRPTYHRRRFGLFALLGAGALVAAMMVRWRPFRVEIAGSSMAPALQPGDWAVAAAVRTSRIRRGDVVVVRHPIRPENELVKRVTGGPGDEVHPGRRLGPDEWFVTGDNAGASTDSRTLGPVPTSAIRARVLFVYWPLRRRHRTTSLPGKLV